MKKHIQVISVLLAISSIAIARPVSSSVDYGAFLSQYDFHWDNNIACDVDSLAGGKSVAGWAGSGKRGYYSGALMGNGLLGTNFYKLKPNVYRMNMGRSDVTQDRMPFGLDNTGRLAIGYFTLATVGEVLDEKMDLSLYDATTSGRFLTSRGTLNFKTYVHARQDVVIFESKAEGGETDYKWDFVPFKAISPRLARDVNKIPSWFVDENGNANPPAKRIDCGSMHFLVQPLSKDRSMKELVSVYVVAWKDVCKADTRRIFATVSKAATENDAIVQARRILEKASACTSGQLSSSHLNWWHNFYTEAAYLAFDDAQIEGFYWRQYYKFASTARPGKPVVDLQGVWPIWDTPWPAIWVNLNLQLTYCWQTKANLGYLAQPLWDALWDNRENLTKNVTSIAGQEDWTDSAVLPRASSYNFLSPLNPILADRNQYEVGNLAWTLHYYWLQCNAYQDYDAMKNKLFPLLKSAVNIFFHIRETRPDGSYSLPVTASPEYGEGEFPCGPNTNYDLANLRQGLLTLIKIDDLCQIHDPMRAQWEDFLEKMPQFQYNENTGYMISEKQEFMITTHRHYSHLFMIYPYHMVSWDNPEDRKKMELSIDRWQGNIGYSRVGKAAMLASDGRGTEALEQIKFFLDKWLQPNTLYAESGPVIETPLATMSALHEFYLQDWGDCIRVFYGIPDQWKNAEFRNMRAQGGFLVSAKRVDGKTTRLSVSSQKGGQCRLKVDGNDYTVDIKPGRTVMVINTEN